MRDSLALDLLQFIDTAPSPFHAVEVAAHRLEAGGFRRIEEAEPWEAKPGDKLYTVRDGASLVAFVVGTEPAEAHGFRLIGAHTDSPTLRVKPSADVKRHGYTQLAMEIYGGVLLHTWLDRDLALAGRVWLSSARGPEAHSVDLGRDLLLRVPSLAIHLDRTVNSEGLKLNPQDHMVPVVGLADAEQASLTPRLAARLERPAREVLGWELSAYAVQPGTVGGADGAFLYAPRLDNLAGCHGALTALLP